MQASLTKTNNDTRLGTLLLEGNLIREADLERCLELQTLTGGTRPLGQILIEQDVVTEEELAYMLRLQRERKAEHEPIGVTTTGVSRFILAAAKAGATELILSEGKPTMLRRHGEMWPLDDERLESPEMWQFLLDFMGADVLDKLAALRYVTAAFELDGMARGRITAFRHFDGACAVVRLHPFASRSIETAGLGDAIRQAVKADKGLILLTGQRGCGITSTLATLLGEVVSHGDPKRVIVLDEIQEYAPTQGDSEVIFRRVGVDTRTYESGLESAIREDPDVLIVADVSSPKAFDFALRAAEGGCLVIAALTAKCVQSAIQRALNFYPEYDVQRIRNTLATVLNCVMRLQLVPDLHDSQLIASSFLALDDASRAVLRNGHIDRIGLLMLMENSGSGYTLDSHLEDLFKANKISLEDAFRCADDKARFLKRSGTQEWPPKED